MATRWKDVAAGAVIVAFALMTWLPGLTWGLPSRDSDHWMFGDRPAWSGREVLDKLSANAAVSAERTTGADVDATPIDRSKPVVLNDTDARRAAIVQRFRLMSGQPDEFIQFKALAEMSQRTGLARLDPRLYQYGGLWIYPVGGLVRGAMAAGWIESPPAGVSAREFYLDRPDAFGKFYVVGRAYSLAWGLVAAAAVYLLARRATTEHRDRFSSRDATPSLVLKLSTDARRPATALRRGHWVDIVVSAVAAIVFVALPAVRTAAHEAKPHLAGAALCLCATLAALQFVSTGRRRWLLIAGAVCGAAMGMVVSMVVSLALLPAAAWMRARVLHPRPGAEEGERHLALSLIAAAIVATIVYAATNPFVLINAIAAPHLLRSNLGNSTAMYGVRAASAMIPDAIRIAGHAMTPIGFRISLAALLTILTVTIATRRRTTKMPSTTSVLLAAPAMLVALQFILLAAGKPAEYARFGLVVWAALCVVVVAATCTVAHSPRRAGGVFLLTLVLAFLIPPISHGVRYDAWQWPQGDHSALQIDTMRQLGEANGAHPWRLGVAYEPAPWSTPPVNLFDQEIVLVRATPAMLEEVDAFVWPVNLESQVFDAATDRESLDWRQNRFGHRAEARDGDLDRWRGGW